MQMFTHLTYICEIINACYKKSINRNLIFCLGAENAEMYRNSVPSNSYGMSSNLVNGHHHEMHMNNFGQPAVTNGYGMNLKQEPDVNF